MSFLLRSRSAYRFAAAVTGKSRSKHEGKGAFCRLTLAGASWLAVVAAVWLALPGAAGAGDDAPQNVVRVEEDWVLQVRSPHLEGNSPQVTTVLSPDPDSGVYLAFDINHRSLPEFTSGGLQLQAWNDDEPMAHSDFPSGAGMDTPGEVVTWTQAVALDGAQMTFEIKQGASTTWGEFGGDEHLKATIPSPVADLHAYRVDYSVSNSGVGYAANRVELLVLKEVRWYGPDGLVHKEDTPVVVYQHP
jgi:hypothetical protein